MAQLTNPMLYNFSVLSAADFWLNTSSAIKEMEAGTLDGVIVEGLIAPQEVVAIVRRFQEIIAIEPFRELYYAAPFGHVFGATLMESDLEGYFRKVPAINRAFEQIFQHRFVATVWGMLSKLGGGYGIYPTVHRPDAVFSIASMRILEPGFDSLEAHIHQEFPLHFSSYQAVSAQLDLSTELSYYIVLQKPEAGGELVLYDLQWGNTPAAMLQSDVFLTGVRSEDLAQYDQMLLSLDEGDAILFPANRIWHKVAAVSGATRARITIGGFLAKARTAEEYRVFI
ncbi:MAG TPA: hypothetical protein PKC76_09730 [Saprospiraceae bacterium]|nr:hypothetical protein [Saprospiraceae bacterium]HMP24401.1 hypothetical protein [Saprospiraceae bacterium]